MKHSVPKSLQFGAKNESPASAMATCSSASVATQLKVIVVLFWTKCAVTHQIKSKVLKLPFRRGQSNLSIFFIFVGFEVKGHYRVVLIRKLSFVSARIPGAVAVCKAVKSLSKLSPETKPPQFYKVSLFNWLL